MGNAKIEKEGLMSESDSESPSWRRERAGRNRRLNRVGEHIELPMKRTPRGSAKTAAKTTAKTPKSTFVQPAPVRESQPLDLRLLLLMLVVSVVVFFVLFFLFFAPSAAGAASTGGSQKVDVSRSELLQLLEKQKQELEAFLKSAHAKNEQKTDALRAALPDQISPLVKKHVEAAKENLKKILDDQHNQDVSKISKARDEITSKLRQEIAPLVKSEVNAVEQKLSAQVDLNVKSIEQRVVRSLPSSSKVLDLRKKDYAKEAVAKKSSPTYKDYDPMLWATYKVLGFTMHPPAGPDSVVQPFVENRCWLFEGSKGSLSLRLHEKTKVGSIGLHMTKRDLSFFVSNTPKEFKVYGTSALGKRQLLGQGAYDLDGPEQQTFPVSSASLETDLVTIEFLSNHGSKQATCIQKVSVHADEK